MNKVQRWVHSRCLIHYTENLLFTLVIGIPGAEAYVDLKDTSRSTFITLAFERFLCLLFSFIARGPFLFKSKKTFKPVFCWNSLEKQNIMLPIPKSKNNYRSLTSFIKKKQLEGNLNFEIYSSFEQF